MDGKQSAGQGLQVAHGPTVLPTSSCSHLPLLRQDSSTIRVPCVCCQPYLEIRHESLICEGTPSPGLRD